MKGLRVFLLFCLGIILSASMALGEEWNTLVNNQNVGLCSAVASDGSSVVGYGDSESNYFTLVKLDKDGVITKTIDVKHEQSFLDVDLFDLVYSTENNQDYLYAIAECANTTSTRKGVIYKLDSDLNVIWRTYLADFSSMRRAIVTNNFLFAVGLSQGSPKNISWTQIGFDSVVNTSLTVHSDVQGDPMKTLYTGNTAVVFGHKLQDTAKTIGINLSNNQILWSKDYYDVGTHVKFRDAQKVFSAGVQIGYVISGDEGYNSTSYNVLFRTDLNCNVVSQKRYTDVVGVVGVDGNNFIVAEKVSNSYKYSRVNYLWNEFGVYAFMEGLVGRIVTVGDSYLGFGYSSIGDGTYVRYYKPDTAPVVVLPIANAGPDKAANEGATVSLSASGSTIGTYPVSYSWESLDDVTITNPNSVTCSFTAPQTGVGGEVKTFQVTVTDSQGNQSVDTVQVTVNNILKLTTVNAGVDQVKREGDSFTLSGSVNVGDYPVASQTWSEVNGKVNIANPNLLILNLTAINVGIGGETFTFKLRVVDTAGNAVEDTVSVVVNNIDQGPMANAGVDQAVEEGDTVYLNGSATAGDFPVASYQWTGGDVIIINANSANPYFIAPQVGETEIFVTLSLVVTDSFGYSSTDTVSVTVTKTVPVDPEFGYVAEGDVTMKYQTQDVEVLNLNFISLTKDVDAPELIPSIGLLDIDVKHRVPGSTVTIKAIFKNPIPEGYGWYKNTDQVWSIYPGAAISADRKEVDLTFTDGGMGDDDGIVNGWTQDPSGPGKIASTDDDPDEPEEPEVPGAEGGGGGGCFIASSTESLVVNPWGAIAIIIFVALAMRKRSLNI